MKEFEMSRSIKSDGVPSSATSGAEEPREHRHPRDPQAGSFSASLDSELLGRLAAARADELEQARDDALRMFLLIEQQLACALQTDYVRTARTIAHAMADSLAERADGADELQAHVAELRARAAAPFAGTLQ
jgi:hypothetical protein